MIEGRTLLHRRTEASNSNYFPMTYKALIGAGVVWLIAIVVQLRWIHEWIHGPVGIQVSGSALPWLRILLMIAYLCFYLGWVIPLGLGVLKLFRLMASRR